MGGGAGGAMNWWWDSYIHPYNLYQVFKGAGIYAQMLNMNGPGYEQLFDVDEIEINNPFINLMGYRFPDRIYGYLFDKTWAHYNYQNIIDKNNINISIPFTDGEYRLTVYDTDSGEVIKSEDLVVSNQVANFTIAKVKFDIAFIIESKE